jgi:hypothetical protein
MTREQIERIDFSVNQQFRLLLEIKEKYHRNEWTNFFEEIVRETLSKIIWDFENFFLLDNYSFLPMKRNFKEEDSELQKEIHIEIINRFNKFRLEHFGNKH